MARLVLVQVAEVDQTGMATYQVRDGERTVGHMYCEPAAADSVADALWWVQLGGRELEKAISHARSATSAPRPRPVLDATPARAGIGSGAETDPVVIGGEAGWA